MHKLYNLYVICPIFSWSHTITSCKIQNLFHHWSFAKIKSRLQCTHETIKNSHTLTQLFNGKAWSWKPQISVYNICHRDHVKILIKIWSYQALSTIQSLHTNKARSCKSMHRSLPPASLPLMRNPYWRMALNEFKFIHHFSCNPDWNLHWVLDAINASL